MGALRTTLVQGSNADGEPVEPLDTGRDGVLAPLRASGLTDCAAFVVRHWDGHRLGLKRLVEAYAAAVRRALEAAEPQVPGPGGTTELAGADAKGEGASSPGPEAPGRTAQAKEQRRLAKALREIAELEACRARGGTLQANQLRKLERAPEYAAKLAALQATGPFDRDPAEASVP